MRRDAIKNTTDDNPNLIEVTEKLHPIYRILADVSFFVFLFFAFFGTSMPFQARNYDVQQIGSSNLINQVVYTLLFLLAAISVLPKLKQLIELIKKEQFLSLFLFWCTLSIVWSNYSFIALKRLFQFYTVVIICLSVLLHHDSLVAIMKHFKILLSIYLVLTLIAVLTIPGASDPTSYSWRGLTPSKNLLGQSALISILIWFNSIKQGNLPNKLISIFMLIISLILLFGSLSMTSISVFFIIVCLAILFKTERSLFYKLGIGNSYSAMVLIAVGFTFFVTYYTAPEVLTALPESFGKDATFTGRTELWSDIFQEVKNQFILGHGFNSFWGINNPNLYYLYQKYIWLPNQAHNGYLDILIDVGIIGLLLFIGLIIKYFINFRRLNKPHFWIWFFIAGLVINLQETTLFSPKHPSGIM
ncbi:hypothetical protein B6D60_12165, partial [candidate division KSB1 bacterium 4484_87]